MNFKDCIQHRESQPTLVCTLTPSILDHPCAGVKELRVCGPACPGLPLLSTAALSCLLQPRLYLESLKNAPALSGLHHPSFTPALQSCYKRFFS